MRQKIRNFMMAAVTALTLAVPAYAAVAPATVFAAGNNITSGVCTGVNDAAGGGNNCTTSVNAENSLSKIAKKIINIFSIVIGIIAVIMILVGGFKYITSGGSSEKIGGAKNTIIYAIIGLIIVALAQFIVHYVLNASTSAVQ